MNTFFKHSKLLYTHFALLLVVIGIAYSKVLKAGFMNWDDLDYVFNTPDITNGLSFELMKHWFSQNYLGNYQPLPIFTYAVDYLIGGANPLIYHLDNLCWHYSATLLVYHFITLLTRNKTLGFVVALLFAIHPVQSESVSWIAARNKSMNAVFYFSALCFYVSYVRTQKNATMLVVTFCGLLAYLCKATALSLPLALFSVDIWLQRPLTTRKVWLEKLPLVLIGIPIALITLHAQREVNFLQHHKGFDWRSFIFAGYAFVQYIYHLLAPFQLSVLYPYPKEITLIHFVCFFLAVAIFILMLVGFRKGWHIWSGGIWFFLVNLLPVLQLVQFGETLMADRYVYIACLGLWFPLVYYLFLFSKKRFRFMRMIFTTSLCLFILLLTFFRNSIWLNEINFWTSVIEKFPESPIAQYSLGAAYMNTGDLMDAEFHMNAAIHYDPTNYKAWRNKGLLCMRQGKLMEAHDALNKSLRLYPYPKSYFTRALLYHRTRNFVRAVLDLNMVLEQQPNNARAYYIKADCEEQLGEPLKAMHDFSKAIFFDCQEPLFLIRRGLLHAKNGNKKAAFNDLDRAVNLNLNKGESYFYRALVCSKFGENPCNDLQMAFQNGCSRAGNMLHKNCE